MAYLFSAGHAEAVQAERDTTALKLAHAHGGVNALIVAKTQLARELRETRALMEEQEMAEQRFGQKEAEYVNALAKMREANGSAESKRDATVGRCRLHPG